jgi:hypothetical protein
MFNVGPAAAAAKVSMNETLAAISTLTASGVPTSVATTQIRAALVGLQRPSADMDAIFQKLGYTNAQTAIEARGLKFALDAVMQASNGSTGTLTTLLGSTEAVQAAQVLAGTGAQKFATDLQAQASAAGAADEAYAKMADTAANKYARAREELGVIAREAGEAVLPAFTALAQVMLPVVKMLADIAQTPVGQALFIAAGGMGALLIPAGMVLTLLPQLSDGLTLVKGGLAAVRAGLVAEKLASWGSAAWGAVTAAYGWATANAALALSFAPILIPIGIVAAAIAALYYGIKDLIAIYDIWKERSRARATDKASDEMAASRGWTRDKDGTIHKNVEKRAAGGAVSVGVPYWVGEDGPELVVPQTAGTVIPNALLKASGDYMGAGAAGGSVAAQFRGAGRGAAATAGTGGARTRAGDTYNLYFNGPAYGDAQLRRMIRDEIAQAREAEKFVGMGLATG